MGSLLAMLRLMVQSSQCCSDLVMQCYNLGGAGERELSRTHETLGVEFSLAGTYSIPEKSLPASGPQDIFC